MFGGFEGDAFFEGDFEGGDVLEVGGEGGEVIGIVPCPRGTALVVVQEDPTESFDVGSYKTTISLVWIELYF